ncbi:ficolin-2-like [Patiria miniata]|uniref:Uncharacterized protein n=1 Tax=Patiria miniata TaxID=46514 RepID=A0A914A5V5_PATMI|nr:ficolin-2-like [Patiria miniata]
MAKIVSVFKATLLIFTLFGRTFKAVVGFENKCDSGHQLILYAAENRALRQFAYVTKTTRSRVTCGRECSMDKYCKSINFYGKSGLCELNNATRQDHAEDFLAEQGSVYFDAAKNTTIFSLVDTPLAHAKSCKKLLEAGYNTSGVYTIYPEGYTNGLQVYCDMETDGGGWIVFQRREDGSVDFYRSWAEYQFGFGNLSGEFWLGNDNLMSLTSQGLQELRVDLEDWENNTAWAKYGQFKLYRETYHLVVEQYNSSSTAPEYLSYGHGWEFTTKDRDNDFDDGVNCADYHEGAWWFDDCRQIESCHLNGKYYHVQPGVQHKGIRWINWHYDVSLKSCSMKLR